MNPGICEQVLNKLLSKEIDSSSHIVKTGPIDNEEAAKILSKYLAEVIEQGLANIKDNGGKIADQITLCNRLIDTTSGCQGILQQDLLQPFICFIGDKR